MSEAAFEDVAVVVPVVPVFEEVVAAVLLAFESVLLSDFEYEFQMALANKKLYNDAETVFLTTTGENMFLSSSVVKEIASFGGDITGFVPKQIQSKITDRLYKPANNIDQ